jgi:hypothetical protein
MRAFRLLGVLSRSGQRGIGFGGPGLGCGKFWRGRNGKARLISASKGGFVIVAQFVKASGQEPSGRFFLQFVGLQSLSQRPDGCGIADPSG